MNSDPTESLSLFHEWMLHAHSRAHSLHQIIELLLARPKGSIPHSEIHEAVWPLAREAKEQAIVRRDDCYRQALTVLRKRLREYNLSHNDRPNLYLRNGRDGIRIEPDRRRGIDPSLQSALSPNTELVQEMMALWKLASRRDSLRGLDFIMQRITRGPVGTIARRTTLFVGEQLCHRGLGDQVRVAMARGARCGTLNESAHLIVTAAHVMCGACAEASELPPRGKQPTTIELARRKYALMIEASSARRNVTARQRAEALRELRACHAEAAAQGPEPLREALVKLIHFVSRRDVELGLFFLRQAVTDDEERATIEIFRSMLRRRAETPLVEGAVDGVLRGYLEDTAAMDRLLEALPLIDGEDVARLLGIDSPEFQGDSSFMRENASEWEPLDSAS